MRGNLTFKPNAVDILDDISNVQHTVNAQGRTETWANSLSRYFMLHVTWRFNVMPKKKAGMHGEKEKHGEATAKVPA